MIKKTIYWKMTRGMSFICPHELETQTEVVLTTSQGKQESAQRFDMEVRACPSATREWNPGRAIFFKIQVWKILIHFSYRYNWTIIDVMSCQHKIVKIPNLGVRRKADIKGVT